MIELLAFLRANGFKTFIVSGGGIEFMRPTGSASSPSRDASKGRAGCGQFDEFSPRSQAA
jgi:hypothetical protein